MVLCFRCDLEYGNAPLCLPIPLNAAVKLRYRTMLHQLAFPPRAVKSRLLPQTDPVIANLSTSLFSLLIPQFPYKIYLRQTYIVAPSNMLAARSFAAPARRQCFQAFPRAATPISVRVRLRTAIICYFGSYNCSCLLNLVPTRLCQVIGY
jgi:hypothetical protein